MLRVRRVRGDSVQYQEGYICSTRTECAVRGDSVQVTPSPHTTHSDIQGDSADHRTFGISSNSYTVLSPEF